MREKNDCHRIILIVTVLIWFITIILLHTVYNWQW